MLLSVLSALVRLDVDPWQEAAELARLPGGPATQRLAALIAALPAGPSARLDPGTIASRLIALLPRRAVSPLPSRETVLGTAAVAYSRAIICVIFMVLMLSAQWIVASRLAPAPTADTGAPAASTVSPGKSPPNAGPGH